MSHVCICCNSYVSAYLQEHVIEDEKQVCDLSCHNEDVEPTGGLVKTNAPQLAVELKSSCEINGNSFGRTHPDHHDLIDLEHCAPMFRAGNYS